MRLFRLLPIVVLGAALIIGLPRLFAHGEDHPKSETAAADEGGSVKGEVVDLSCYLPHGEKGEKHRKCAEQCAAKGLPMGILGADGTVVLLVEDHQHPEAYKQVIKRAADTVTVKGKVVTKGGIRAIEVQGVQP